MSGQRQNYNMKGKGRFQGKSSNYRSQIEFGARGFFVTVDGINNEKPAVREFYNLFDLCYAEIEQKQVEPNDGPQGDTSIDASDELSVAIAEAKNTNQSQRGNETQKRLRQIPTSVKNCLFFQTDIPVQDVYLVANNMIEKCQEKNFCRFVARCIPVDNSTATEITHFSRDMERLIHYYFVENWKEDKSPTYSLEFKARNNDQLTKQDVLAVIDERIRSMAPLARVNLTSPDLSILVNVLQKNVLLSCVRNYQQKRKCATRPPKEENESNKKTTTAADVKSTSEEKVET